ncbi:hypothetical protein NECAME_11377 [Necator americanus]|uniref:Protein kinase domain-containing protein n=1 Tax=Necator americanus TaxID=51031 RepID=W2T793_NECAM|nr:hypothetical protein NECAME_11377 [Necator americanus]ETN76857.1 hypothetical protein NECAME_11377 [Necator americanus]
MSKFKVLGTEGLEKFARYERVGGGQFLKNLSEDFGSSTEEAVYTELYLVVKVLNAAKMVHETVKRVKIEMFDHWSQSDFRVSHALKALHYLHSLEPPVVHRDIKAANLLLTISDSIKLANFGLIRDLAIDGFGIAVGSDISLDFRGTLLYVAPEVLTSQLGPGNRNAYGKPADVWALGCTLIEMLTKYPPHFEYFGEVEGIQKEILDRASGDKSDWLPYDAEILIPTCSQSVHNLVNSIFERDPNNGKNPAEIQVTSSKDENTVTKGVISKDALPSFTPLETLENGSVRRKRKTVSLGNLFYM